MDDPTALNSINNKLTLLNVNDNFGSGLKVSIVNDETANDTLTICGSLGTSGSRYITENSGINVGLGAFTVNTIAVTYNLSSNTLSFVKTVRVTGVDGSLNEVTELVVLNGTTNVPTVNTYLFVNDIELVVGTSLTGGQAIYCTPSVGQAKRLVLSDVAKYNWGIMVGRKNGVNRVARLTSINSVTQTAASDYNLCVFTGANSADVAAGLCNVKLRLRGFQSPCYGPIDFGTCGIVEVRTGEIAAFYRQSTSSTTCSISATFTYYNA